MVTPMSKVGGSRLVMLSFHSFFFNFYFFSLELFPSMSFILSTVTVPVSARHLEVGVKINRENESPRLV